MFNYLLMPTTLAPLDPALIELDAMFGYDWSAFVAWAGDHMMITEFLRVIYMSTIPQIALLIIILGLSGKSFQLHVMMVSITITSVIAVVFWGYFPSHGASSIHVLAQDLEALVMPPVGTAYGRELIRLAADGPGFISPSNVKGVIGFPSFHAVLAFTAAYGMRGVRGLFPLFVIINIIMIPATMLHGGHHMVDVAAGFLLFVFGTIAAERLVRGMYQSSGDSTILDRDMDTIREPMKA